MEAEPPRWPHRFALAALWCAVPLVLFGGSVTTMGAGMAVEGWLDAEGHFLLLFPVEKWLRDEATFVEHTHRLFGSLVGFAMLACVAAAWSGALARGAKLAATAALVAVAAQGALGGLRVLEDDPDLAFLHGVAAQAVFAALAANAVVLSPRWRARGSSPRAAPSAGRLAALAAAVVLGQATLGAMLRHAVHPAPEGPIGLLLAAHLGGALAALAVLVALVRRLAAAGDPVLVAARKRLAALLVAQIVLGFVSWRALDAPAVGAGEVLVTAGHVLVSAALLAQCVAVALHGLARGSARSAGAALVPDRTGGAA